MKIYIVTFNNLEIAIDKAYTSRTQAEKDMRRLAEDMDSKSAELQIKSYSHFYSVDELELVFSEPTQSTLEEVYEL